MAKLKVWSAPTVTSFKLHLLIHGIECSVAEKSENWSGSSLMVQIEWRGSGRTGGFISKGYQRSCTSKQQIQANGGVSWHEGFSHTCKLKRMDSHCYREWITGLKIQEVLENNKGKLSTIAKVMVDVAKFMQPDSEKGVRIPIKCNIRGHVFEAVLMVELQLTEVQNKDSMSLSHPRAVGLHYFSCTGFPRTSRVKLQNPTAVDGRLPRSKSTHPSTTDYSSDDEPDFHHRRAAMTNFVPVANMLDDSKDVKERCPAPNQTYVQAKQQQPSLPLVRFFSLNKSKLRSNSVNHSKCLTPINKANDEDGGDDIDKNQRHQSSIQFLPTSDQQTKVHPEENPQHRARGFPANGLFDIRHWENRKVVSRDGQMELVTDIFLATIDQRSKKAAGGGACTVLAAVIADWLHNNPKRLPLRWQFDELVHEGSFEWRKLCANENHKKKFSDHHFDLETVLEAKLRPLSVVTEMSYIGFFSLDDGMPDSLEFLKGAMTFDSIWKELLCSDQSEERIYITSWNDHFFVLKIERDAIYLIDTLGERLHEGGNQAYILRFNKESVVYRRHKEPGCQTEDSSRKSIIKDCPNSITQNQDHIPPQQVICEGMTSCREVICEGMNCCREYIKGFLAAVPLRELQHEIKRGMMEKASLDRRLQIEFQYTAPCTMRY